MHPDTMFRALCAPCRAGVFRAAACRMPRQLVRGLLLWLFVVVGQREVCRECFLLFWVPSSSSSSSSSLLQLLPL